MLSRDPESPLGLTGEGHGTPFPEVLARLRLLSICCLHVETHNEMTQGHLGSGLSRNVEETQYPPKPEVLKG